MTLGGTTIITRCSFLSNSAISRGLAIAAVASSAVFSNSSFESNELYCDAGLYRHDIDEVRR